MELFGHEYKLRFSVGAVEEIGALCPEGKIENIEKLMDVETKDGLKFICKMAVIMSKYGRICQAWAQNLTLDEFDATTPRLTEEMVMSLDIGELQGLMNEVFETLHNDAKQTVNLARAKKNKATPKKGETSA